MNSLANLYKFLAKYNLKDEAENLSKLAAEQDFKYLKKINLAEIKYTVPKENRREFFEKLDKESEEGPIFSKETLEIIRQLDSLYFPTENHKIFVKWLANSIENEKNGGHRVLLHELENIRDWLNGTNWIDQWTGGPLNLNEMSFEDALLAAQNWHDELAENVSEDIKPIEGGEIVYQFNNGYTIRKLTGAKELKEEGDAMGHCVGQGHYGKDYWIYSLRNPNNQPKVTISVIKETGQVEQIKGAFNTIVDYRYADYIYDWKPHTDFNWNCYDFSKMPLSAKYVIESRDNNLREYIARGLFNSRPDTINKTVAEQLYDILIENLYTIPIDQQVFTMLLNIWSKEQALKLAKLKSRSHRKTFISYFYQIYGKWLSPNELKEIFLQAPQDYMDILQFGEYMHDRNFLYKSAVFLTEDPELLKNLNFDAQKSLAHTLILSVLDNKKSNKEDKETDPFKNIYYQLLLDTPAVSFIELILSQPTNKPDKLLESFFTNIDKTKFKKELVQYRIYLDKNPNGKKELTNSLWYVYCNNLYEFNNVLIKNNVLGYLDILNLKHGKDETPFALLLYKESLSNSNNLTRRQANIYTEYINSQILKHIVNILNALKYFKNKRLFLKMVADDYDYFINLDKLFYIYTVPNRSTAVYKYSLFKSVADTTHLPSMYIEDILQGATLKDFYKDLEDFIIRFKIIREAIFVNNKENNEQFNKPIDEIIDRFYNDFKKFKISYKMSKEYMKYDSGYWHN